MKKESQVIFDKNVVEFVTVAAEFCAFLERAEGMKRSMFVDTTLKILPLLYLKASMLPKCEKARNIKENRRFFEGSKANGPEKSRFSGVFLMAEFLKIF